MAGRNDLNYDSKPRGVPTAAGHNQYPMEKLFREQFEDEFYNITDISQLATNQTLEPLRRCGQTIEWRTQPHGVIRDYYINMRLENDFPEWSKNEVTIGHAKYYNMKIDDVDMQMMCDSRDIFNEVMADLMRQKADILTAATIREMILGAHPKNRGNCAGHKKKKYCLGECDDPLRIDCDRIAKFNQHAHGVLTSASVVAQRRGQTSNNPGTDPFMLVPDCYWEVWQESQAKGCCPAVERSALEDGSIRLDLGNFDMWTSSMLDEFAHELPTGEIVYPIIFGRKDATGAVVTLDKSREVNDHPDYFASFMQGLFVYGQSVITRQGLGLAWVTFVSTSLK
jgi:hypothetical protein